MDWCPNDGTLAREQVEGTDRRCWRCGAKVEKRELPQWYLGITDYADELLDFTGIDWPEPVKLMQTNWIGRSSGAEIVFETAPSAHHAGGEELRVFTTRPDTLFGATFMVLAPEHELVATLTAPDRRAEVDAYVAARGREDGDRPPVDGPREDRRRHRRGRDQPRQRRADPDLHRGLRAGHATAPARSWPCPPTTSATSPSRRRSACRSSSVVMPKDADPDEELTAAFTEHTVDEVMVNSGRFTGLPAAEAWHDIVEWLGERGKGEQAVTYRLRDWLISRQRYWGTPIPVIHCDGLRPGAGARGRPAGPAARDRRLPRLRRQPAHARRGRS